MRGRDCMRQMKMKCAYSIASAELQYSAPWAHGQASQEGFTWASKCEAA